MQVSVLAHRGLRIGNKETECSIQNLLPSASLKNAENSEFLNKEISIVFNIIFISSKCAYHCEVIFYRNSPQRPALGVPY